jgi:HEAT repeat protein
LRYAQALDALIETLGHRISNLRKEAALALGELNEKGAI